MFIRMDEKTHYWIALSEYDLETAKVMLSGKRFLYVGFMCHQVVEKALKAYYQFFRKNTPPHIHNLSVLASQGGLYGNFDELQKDLLDVLEPLNVEARYPTHKDQLFRSLTEERCKAILESTEELFAWIIQRLSNQ
jgi:HEPN domain-containing protein